VKEWINRFLAVIEEYGSNARGFVGNCRWNDVVDEFEGVLEELV